MSGSFAAVGNNDTWSPTDFTPESDFSQDTESLEANTDDLFDLVAWDVEETAARRKPPRTSQICNGPRLLPRIRDQDQALDLAAPARHEVSEGCGRPKVPLAGHTDFSKVIQSTGLIANSESYNDVIQQGYTQEHFHEITPPPPHLEFTSSNSWPYTPEDHNKSLPSTHESFSGSFYDQTDESYFAQDLSSFPLYNHHYDSSPYLTLPNPASNLVKQVQGPDQARDPHYFWDVRNVREWPAFKLQTMFDIPELRSLLCDGIPSDNLPTPRPVSTSPLKREDLRLAHMKHYGSKLNAALRSSSIQSALLMYSDQSASLATPPDFISSASTSQEQNIVGNSRVVGIVLCYHQWDSSMRYGDKLQQIKYLHGLARLQHALRECHCRYGFIITEIELVCVRYGGDDIIAQQAKPAYTFPQTISGHFIPIFGYFEVSAAIPLSHNHVVPDTPYGSFRMTAGLALWYLHMHARDTPLPGQSHWRIDVGTAITRTRQKHLPKDEWVPKPSALQERWAKTRRGWLWPADDLNQKKEVRKNRHTVMGKRKS
ncbi:hypothetical protein E4T52_06362 [Aureobasidium sp. EXF-3400]|nr:hypothetical protein E4T51_05450 [Aureobasidium sp. EXF-12344]KAI4778724.1 hypothetical protein E4T52_06362 [Aureobasidium sp. EXF-3400]